MTDREKPRIARKYIKTVEIEGEGELDLKIGQRLVYTKTITEAVSPPSGLTAKRVMPRHVTVVTIECTEFEGYDYGTPA